jgi:hypothetical protein
LIGAVISGAAVVAMLLIMPRLPAVVAEPGE